MIKTLTFAISDENLFLQVNRFNFTVVALKMKGKKELTIAGMNAGLTE